MIDVNDYVAGMAMPTVSAEQLVIVAKALSAFLSGRYPGDVFVPSGYKSPDLSADASAPTRDGFLGLFSASELHSALLGIGYDRVQVLLNPSKHEPLKFAEALEELWKAIKTQSHC